MLRPWHICRPSRRWHDLAPGSARCNRSCNWQVRRLCCFSAPRQRTSAQGRQLPQWSCPSHLKLRQALHAEQARPLVAAAKGALGQENVLTDVRKQAQELQALLCQAEQLSSQQHSLAAPLKGLSDHQGKLLVSFTSCCSSLVSGCLACSELRFVFTCCTKDRRLRQCCVQWLSWQRSPSCAARQQQGEHP